MAFYINTNALKKKIKLSHEKRLGHGSKEISDLQLPDDLSFASLYPRLSQGTVKAIEDIGLKIMTEIQAKSIPTLLEGKNLQGIAKTGSGKTYAFLIPVIELMVKLKFKPRNGTGAIIISPTRELAMQTYGFLSSLMKYHKQTFDMLIGASDRKLEVEKLKKGVNILVTTPGTLLAHLQSESKFHYKNLACLVIDEADRLLDFGFEEKMNSIVEFLPEYSQMILFSATKNDKTKRLAELLFKASVVDIDVKTNAPQATVEELEQAFLICPLEKRFLVLYMFLKKSYKKKVMVFFSSAKACQFYHDLLNYINIPVMSLHGKQTSESRTQRFYKFCNAKSGILLCTNLAARGCDIPRVHWIVQYDPPDNPTMATDEMCKIGVSLGDECHKRTYCRKAGFLKINKLEPDGWRILSRRYGVSFNEADQICLHHEKVYLTHFENLHKFCADPLSRHKKLITKSLRIVDKEIAWWLNLKPGQKLCSNFYEQCVNEIPKIIYIYRRDYIHRVGRTARAGRKGSALLFLTEEESSFISYMKTHKVDLFEMNIEWSKVDDIQNELEEIVNPNLHLSTLGKAGFFAYINAYKSHSLKTIFNVTKLNLDKLAKSFCLEEIPSRPISDERLQKETNENNCVNKKMKF